MAPFLVFAAIGILAAAVFGLRPVAELGDPSNVALMFALVAALKLSQIGLRNRPDFMDITFWVFVLVFFGIAAFSQLRNDRFPLAHSGTYDAVVGETQVRIAAGVAAYLIGRRLARGRSLPRWMADRQVFCPGRAQRLGLVALVVSVPLIAVVGVQRFFSSRDAFSAAVYRAQGGTITRHTEIQDRGVGASAVVLLTILPLVAAAALYCSRRHRGLLAALLVVNVVTNNPIANAKVWLAVVFATGLACVVNLRRRPMPAVAAMGLCAITLFSLSYLDYFRRDERQLERTGPAELVLSADYGMFQQELNGTVYVEEEGYTYGKQFAGSVGVYIPRKIWTSKALDTGDVVGAEAGFNVSATLWTELFIDFGWGGLLAGFVGVGYLFALLDRWMREARGRAPLVIVPAMGAIAMFVLRGSLQPAMGLLIPLALAFWYCTPARRNAVPK